MILLVEEHRGLRLEVLYLKVGRQDILGQLLLQLLLDLLSEPLVHDSVFWVKLGEDNELKAPDNSWLC